MLPIGVARGTRRASDSDASEGCGGRPPTPVACRRIFDKMSVIVGDEAKYPRYMNRLRSTTSLRNMHIVIAVDVYEVNTTFCYSVGRIMIARHWVRFRVHERGSVPTASKISTAFMAVC